MSSLERSVARRPPVCRYCHQTYTQYDEPLYTVCLCDDVPKFVHGTCFNEWLDRYQYGVCEVCLSKTVIVPDGFKNVCKWTTGKVSSYIKLHTTIVIIFALVFIAYVIWWTTASFLYPRLLSLIVFFILLVLLLLTLLLCCFLKPSKLFCYNIYLRNRVWKIIRYENGCGRDQPKAHTTEITQSMGDMREITEIDMMEMRRREEIQKNDSLRSNEDLRMSGMMDEDFYLQSPDSSSIRDRDSRVIGQWI